MERKPVSSSNIKSIGYNESKKLLGIEFNNGSIYEYYNLPEESYFSLMGATSQGKYFNKYIKNIYDFKKVS